MVKIVPTHPHLIADYQDEILQSLNDEDVSIRMRALELVSSMVRRDFLGEPVNRGKHNKYSAGDWTGQST
jgi:AP-3 complex subunit delta-1